MDSYKIQNGEFESHSGYQLPVRPEGGNASWFDSTYRLHILPLRCNWHSIPPLEGGFWEFESPQGHQTTTSMHYTSKEYHQARSKDHYAKYKAGYSKRNKDQRDRTKAIIQQAKSTGCSMCDEKEPCCLDFHHTRDKDIIVSKMLGMSDQRVIDEISKCVVLCANCHRKIHAGILILEHSTLGERAELLTQNEVGSNPTAPANQ